jgi:hypothetical protein
MVVGLFLLVNVVREMRRVPDHYVLVDDVFPVDEAVEPGLERRSRGDCPVVDLRLAEPQYPHVAAPEGISNAVVRPWDQRVASPVCEFLTCHLRLRCGFLRRVASNWWVCQFSGGEMGGELNSRTTLFSAVPMSKSNLQ